MSFYEDGDIMIFDDSGYHFWASNGDSNRPSHWSKTFSLENPRIKEREEKLNKLGI